MYVIFPCASTFVYCLTKQAIIFHKRATHIQYLHYICVQHLANTIGPDLFFFVPPAVLHTISFVNAGPNLS